MASIIHSRIRIRTGVEHVYHDASLNLERSAKEFCLAYTRLDFRGAFFLSITALHSSKRIHPFSRSAERQNSLSLPPRLPSSSSYNSKTSSQLRSIIVTANYVSTENCDYLLLKFEITGNWGQTLANCGLKTGSSLDE